MPPEDGISFEAVLLLGGASRRLGKNKALLTLGGRPLWQRQADLLRSIDPARLHLAAAPGQDAPPGAEHLLHDRYRGKGPLAGIEAALTACRHDLLLVLAVDMPLMTASYLRTLLTRCTPARGCVPLRAGRYEPLAAVYPRAALEPTRRFLARDECKLQDFVRYGLDNGFLAPIDVAEQEASLFTNINTMEDWRSFSKHGIYHDSGTP